MGVCSTPTHLLDRLCRWASVENYPKTLYIGLLLYSNIHISHPLVCRNLPYFSRTSNLDKLRNIITTYVWENLEEGYMQVADTWVIILENVSFNPFLFIRGLSCPNSVKTSLTQNCPKLTIPGFPYNILPVSCGDIGFLKKNPKFSVGLEIRPCAFTAFCPSCRLKLFCWGGCNSPLQKVLAVWRTFFKIWSVQNETSFPAAACYTWPKKFKLKEKCAKLTILSSGLHCPRRTYHGIFSRAEKSFDDINSYLFLMNKKGLKWLLCDSNSLYYGFC